MPARQWAGWKRYCANFPTPMQRADINAATIRHDLGQWKKRPKLKELLVQYGGRRKQSEADIKRTLMAWAAGTKA